MSKKPIKCPFCKDKYTNKPSLYNHMNKTHSEQLDGLSPANIYFNIKNKKTKGNCIICGKETKFNEKTERYDRICSERCSNLYREEFKKRMNQKYGKDHLLDNVEQQQKMQQNRRISGVYKWSDGNEKPYMGTYELDALKYLDITLGLASKDVITPSPITIPYTYKGVKHFYMPDIFVVPYKLLIEVKGSNNHYQKRDLSKEKTKDKAAINSEYNYVKILDKNYQPLNDIIKAIKEL